MPAHFPIRKVLPSSRKEDKWKILKVAATSFPNFARKKEVKDAFGKRKYRERRHIRSSVIFRAETEIGERLEAKLSVRFETKIGEFFEAEYLTLPRVSYLLLYAVKRNFKPSMFNALCTTQLFSFVRRGDAPYKQSITLRDSVTLYSVSRRYYNISSLKFSSREKSERVVKNRGSD